MSNHGHFKKVCPGCQAVLGQCKCPDKDKTVIYEICATCKAAIARSDKLMEVQQKLDKLRAALWKPEVSARLSPGIVPLMRDVRDTIDRYLNELPLPNGRTIEQRREQSRMLCGCD